MRLIDLTGKKFGRLTVIERDGTHITKSGHKMPTWKCVCDCGNVVKVIGANLKNGSSVSCGCYRKERGKESLAGNTYQRTHGLYYTRQHKIWRGMKSRCYNPNDPKYYRYGARGIKVCSEWVNDVKAFFDWTLVSGYADDLSIHRLDNDGDYSPENCVWATDEEQANNTSRSHYITYNEETHTVAEWARALNIPYKTLFKRINDGWDIEKAFTTPLNPLYCRIEYNGKTYTIAELAREYGVQYDTLKQRINKYHWDIERALNTP